MFEILSLLGKHFIVVSDHIPSHFILNTIKIWTFHSFDTYLGTYQYQALGTQVKQEDPWSYGAYILSGRQYFFKNAYISYKHVSQRKKMVFYKNT